MNINMICPTGIEVDWLFYVPWRMFHSYQDVAMQLWVLCYAYCLPWHGTSVFKGIFERPVILPFKCQAFGDGAITTCTYVTVATTRAGLELTTSGRLRREHHTAELPLTVELNLKKRYTQFHITWIFTIKLDPHISLRYSDCVAIQQFSRFVFYSMKTRLTNGFGHVRDICKNSVHGIY